MVFEMGAFLGAALIGLAAWAADAFIKPFLSGLTKGDPLMIGLVLAAFGAAAMIFGGNIPLLKPLGKGAIVAGTIVVAGSVLAPVAQSVLNAVRV